MRYNVVVKRGQFETREAAAAYAAALAQHDHKNVISVAVEMAAPMYNRLIPSSDRPTAA